MVIFRFRRAGTAERHLARLQKNIDHPAAAGRDRMASTCPDFPNRDSRWSSRHTHRINSPKGRAGVVKRSPIPPNKLPAWRPPTVGQSRQGWLTFEEDD